MVMSAVIGAIGNYKYSYHNNTLVTNSYDPLSRPQRPLVETLRIPLTEPFKEP